MPSLLIYGTGWLAGILIVAALGSSSINYTLGRLGRAQLAWLYPWHYRLGLLAAGISILHTLFSITRKALPLAAEVGVVIASAAFALVALQALIGWTMQNMPAQELRRVRRYHLAIASALLVAVGVHIALNGASPAS